MNGLIEFDSADRSVSTFPTYSSSSTSASGWDFECAFVIYDLVAVIIYGVLMVWIACELIYVSYLVSLSTSNNANSSSMSIDRSPRLTQKIFLLITLLQCFFRLLAFVLEPMYYPCKKRDVAEVNLPLTVTYLAPLGFCLFIIAFSLLAYHFAEVFYHLYYLLHPQRALLPSVADRSVVRKQDKHPKHPKHPKASSAAGALAHASDADGDIAGMPNKHKNMKNMKNMKNRHENKKYMLRREGELFASIEARKSRALRRVVCAFVVLNVIFIVLAYVSLEIFMSKYDRSTMQVKDSYKKYERYLDYVLLLFGGLCLMLSVFFGTVTCKIYNLYEKLLTRQMNRMKRMRGHNKAPAPLTQGMHKIHDLAVGMLHDRKGRRFSWRSHSLPHANDAPQAAPNTQNSQNSQNIGNSRDARDTRDTQIAPGSRGNGGEFERYEQARTQQNRALKIVPNAALSPTLSAVENGNNYNRTKGNINDMDRSASQGPRSVTKARDQKNRTGRADAGLMEPLQQQSSASMSQSQSQSQSQSLPNEMGTIGNLGNVGSSSSVSNVVDDSGEKGINGISASVAGGIHSTSRTYHATNVPYSPQTQTFPSGGMAAHGADPDPYQLPRAQQHQQQGARHDTWDSDYVAMTAKDEDSDNSLCCGLCERIWSCLNSLFYFVFCCCFCNDYVQISRMSKARHKPHKSNKYSEDSNQNNIYSRRGTNNTNMSNATNYTNYTNFNNYNLYVSHLNSNYNSSDAGAATHYNPYVPSKYLQQASTPAAADGVRQFAGYNIHYAANGLSPRVEDDRDSSRGTSETETSDSASQSISDTSRDQRSGSSSGSNDLDQIGDGNDATQAKQMKQSKQTKQAHTPRNQRHGKYRKLSNSETTIKTAPKRLEPSGANSSLSQMSQMSQVSQASQTVSQTETTRTTWRGKSGQMEQIYARVMSPNAASSTSNSSISSITSTTLASNKYLEAQSRASRENGLGAQGIGARGSKSVRGVSGVSGPSCTQSLTSVTSGNERDSLSGVYSNYHSVGDDALDEDVTRTTRTNTRTAGTGVDVLDGMDPMDAIDANDRVVTFGTLGTVGTGGTVDSVGGCVGTMDTVDNSVGSVVSVSVDDVGTGEMNVLKERPNERVLDKLHILQREDVVKQGRISVEETGSLNNNSVENGSSYNSTNTLVQASFKSTQSMNAVRVDKGRRAGAAKVEKKAGTAGVTRGGNATGQGYSYAYDKGRYARQAMVRYGQSAREQGGKGYARMVTNEKDLHLQSMKRICFIAFILSVIFLLRGVLLILSAMPGLIDFDASNLQKSVYTHNWWEYATYYIVLETLPLALMISVFHRATTHFSHQLQMNRKNKNEQESKASSLSKNLHQYYQTAAFAQQNGMNVPFQPTQGGHDTDCKGLH